MKSCPAAPRIRTSAIIAEYLTALGIDLKEVRVVPDEEDEIVAALNALRQRYTYVFTTGGIGPTHDDITADCVAKAFGVPIDVDPRAVEIFQARRAPAIELNEARLRMARIPQGADLVENKISAAPGFWIGNVIVMAGVPVDHAGDARRGRPASSRPGPRCCRRSVRADAREGDIGTAARRDRQGQSRGDHRQLSVLRRAAGPTPTSSCARATQKNWPPRSRRWRKCLRRSTPR